MTVSTITFDLRCGALPFQVTLPDASGLAPLGLPTHFLSDGEIRRQPSDDAISRFEAAMSRDAYPAVAERPHRIPREIVVPAPIPVSPPEVVPGRAASTMPPEAAVSSKPPYQVPHVQVTQDVELRNVPADTSVVVERPVVVEPVVQPVRAASTMPPEAAVSSKPSYQVPPVQVTQDVDLRNVPADTPVVVERPVVVEPVVQPGRAASTMPPEMPVPGGRGVTAQPRNLTPVSALTTAQPRDPTPVAAPISVPVEITGPVPEEVKGPVPSKPLEIPRSVPQKNVLVEITGTVPEKPLEEQDPGRAVTPRPPDAVVAPTTAQPRDPTPVAAPISIPAEIAGTVPVVDVGSVPETKGSVPETKGSVPETKGSVPVAEGKEIKGTVPETKGTVPKNIDLPNEIQAMDVRVAAEGTVAMGLVQTVDTAASARTVEIVEMVEKIVAAVSEQIEVVPSLVKGEETVIIHLKPEVLDGSEISMSAKDGVLSLEIAPATPQAAAVVEKGVAQLERALAEHVTVFQGFSVVVKKGKFNETR